MPHTAAGESYESPDSRRQPSNARPNQGFIREFAQEIFECADGCEVLDAYRAHQPDWVLMDVEMPKVDGFTATRNLIRKIPAARVVIVTRYDDDELRKEASLAGACGYVLKEDLTALQSVFLAAS